MNRVAGLGLTLALATAACDGEEPERSTRPVRVEDVSCAELRNERRLRRVARELVVKVVAPDGQSEAETADLLAGSLKATCSQPGRRNHRPVPGVLRAVQSHFDEEAIFEEGR